MRKILGLDLGTNSIGWALVNEAEDENEKSSIIRLGVRVNPLTVDEQQNFEKGKSITTNADRTLKRSARRNLQRYKLRRKNLIEILKENNFIDEGSILSENGNKTTFETYHLRAKAVSKNEKISLKEFSRVLLMINKKRGYKSSRKANNQEEGQLIDGMSVAKELYDKGLTPGQFTLQILNEDKKFVPDYYRSDLQDEFEKIWNLQKQFHSELLTDEFKEQLKGKSKTNTSKIFFAKYQIYTSDNKGTNKKIQAYEWRVQALKNEVSKEILAYVISEINGEINNSSGYLGAISDRSKELYFNKQTVGQYLLQQLKNNPHTRLKNQVFYRQDYLDEFEKIWEHQAKYHKELTKELKHEIRDIIIFYQRKLKSQKGLISFCEFESKQVEVIIDGKKKIKTIGSRVCPKSSPLFQEFKIWQILNNIEISDKKSGTKRCLEQEEKEQLFEELSIKQSITKSEVLKLLFKNPKDLELNFKEKIEGNRTFAAFYSSFQSIIERSGHGKYDFSKMKSQEVKKIVFEIFSGIGYNTDILTFNSMLDGKKIENQASYKLWHLLYSFEDDNSRTGNDKLLKAINEKFGFEIEFAQILANISLQDDYGNLSTKAIRKILPHLKDGNKYDIACVYAGYNHSHSGTKEEKEKKVLKPSLQLLTKNSLRNPVVEKILNQMINVINSIINKYGKPNEIRIELARELKKNAKEREELTKAINNSNTEHEKIKEILRKEFGLMHISRNDIIRYKLYKELEFNNYKTLYSNTYISQEKLFSKEFDIEHIIPQSRLFDDSFSNKTLEKRDINIEKGNDTAYDFIKSKYGEKELSDYLIKIEDLYKKEKISKTKFNKLKMQGNEIPDGFINRDLRTTQYIAKKAKSMLEDVFREVITTTGSVTDRLREDWQLIDVMQELNWNKYNTLGLTEIIENKDGHKIRRIKDWTKRNDHRHHAMDALTVAFTKHAHIQYLNNMSARSNENHNKFHEVYGIEQKYLYRDKNNKLRFKPPMPLDEFRAIAKKQLENTLISIKAKNKVTTINKNKIKGNEKPQVCLTPRGALHQETVYGSTLYYETRLEKVGSNFNEENIKKVANTKIQEALFKRLAEFGNDAKKAFTDKNSLDKNPIYLDNLQTSKVPEKVKLVWKEKRYTIRKDVNPDLKIEKVIDVKIRKILENRLKEFGGDAKKAFINLEENPIWLNKEKGIVIKRVTISGISNAIALHDKKNKDEEFILDEKGNKLPVDFVNTGSNHHVAIYKDEKGNLQENVISFFEATERVNQWLPIIDKSYRESEGWQFLFSMKQNEYFVFPNEKDGFNPNEIDLLDEKNYYLISPNLFRVQKIATKDYTFRHHLETNVEDKKELKEISYKRLGTNGIKNIIKVRINHIGQIVSFGEY